MALLSSSSSSSLVEREGKREFYKYTFFFSFIKHKTVLWLLSFFII